MWAHRHIATLDLVVDDWRWPFAADHHVAIEAHFAALRASKPALWNGRVLLGRDPRFDGDRFSARWFETDFASFIAWRDWGRPDKSVFNGFGMAALRGRDGGFILGEMAPHTVNAGRIYFPAGTPDPSDVRDGALDLAGSVVRELHEETGLTEADYWTKPGWWCLAGDASFAFFRTVTAALSADALQARIVAALAAQTNPELRTVHIVRGRNDLNAAMPDFIAAFLDAQFDAL